MTDRLTEAELDVVRRFFSIVDGYRDEYSDDCVTAIDGEGLTITTFSCGMAYGDPVLDREEARLPLLALTDPEAYTEQVERERRERELAWKQAREAAAISAEMHERNTLRTLLAKYGVPTASQQPPA